MTTMTLAKSSLPAAELSADKVHETIGRHMLVDGFEFVLDLHKSHGSTLVDARTGTEYLDLFTFFASAALGMNHPSLAEDADFRAELAEVAVNKPSNSDVYSVPMARFVATFAHVLGDPRLPHLFFVDGGALAVENALKVAFDWKSRWNEEHGLDPELGTKVLHLQKAFHGRSGYTMSLTNTDPAKVARYPKFDWPRIPSPSINDNADVIAAEDLALAAARKAFEDNPHDIACFIMEPIQGEGGDNHFRPEFLQGMQALCREFDALFVLDEVQTGVGITGTAWAYQQMGIEPDIVAFGKKTQVCGIMAGGRVDEIEHNVFKVPSRINSTWGGNLTDMVRSRRILEVIQRDDLIAHSAKIGEQLLAGLEVLAARHAAVSNVRGRGLMCAFTLPSPEIRDAVIASMREDEHILVLGSGPNSIRFRPALTITAEEIDRALAGIDRSLTKIVH
jgi:L-lysine 6-transaminase